jgi:asparagine synthase (glutamine-hydrolysing)
MCGIAGYFGPGSIADERVDTALSLMHRRGPDHRASLTWGSEGGRHCHLLHSRLNIIDLDPRANQPFSVGAKRIVFNGELYNYREIREEVAKTSYEFRTESDTEVLLAAIDRLGWGVLDRCEGMWAFAVLDTADGSLTMCRDRFGEKPLYVFRENGGVYFASEPKFVFALREQSASLNQQQLYRYLVNGYTSLYKQAGQTFFEGMEEVPSGCLVRFETGGSENVSRYWTPKCDLDGDMSFEDAVAGARERLIRSVELRLRADVPIAFCMSGGVDSNSIISIAKNVFDYDVHGFTIQNTDSRYDEQDVLEESIRQLRVKHTTIPVNTSGFLPKMRRLVAYHDAPVYTISYYAHWLLMEAVAQNGYRISVSGTAADESYSGYFDHHLFHMAEIHGETEHYQAARAGWERVVKPIVRNPFLRDPDRFIQNPGFRDHIYLGWEEFAAFLKTEWSEAFAETQYTDHVLRNRMMNEMFHECTPVMVHDDDLNAMFFSIENRSPFLDRDLFEFCNRIPTRHLIKNGMAKVILRESMRGIVPDCILNNPVKVGFNAPIFDFLDVKDPEVRSYVLDESPIFDHIRRDKIEQLMGKSDLPNSESKFLFYFLSSKMFLEEVLKRSPSTKV